MGPAERAELMLLSLDPQRGFRRVMDDLARFSTLDPKVRVSLGLLDEHFRGYSAQDREILSAVLWAYVRPQLAAGRLGSLRAWLRDGDAFLSAVETALDGSLATPVIKELIEQGRGFAAPEAANSEFQRALDEVRRLEAIEIGPAPVVAFLAGYGAASLYYDLTGQ